MLQIVFKKKTCLVTEEEETPLFILTEDIMIQKLKNFIEWGVYDLDEIIEDKDMYVWFYCSPNFTI